MNKIRILQSKCGIDRNYSVNLIDIKKIKRKSEI